MRVSMIRTATGAVAALLIFLLVLPMAAAFAASEEKVPNGDEAWFLARKEPLAEAPEGDPTCELPTGCNASGQAQRPNNHPEGTLVVAANSGDPDAQTFFNFDLLGSLPFGAIVTGGTVTMPVAQDPDARNARPDAARMVACMVAANQFIPGGTDAGSYKDRPKINDKVCVDVKKTKDDPLTYSFDLERFGKAWSSGAPQNGVSVMVDPEVTTPDPRETWRVVFNSRRRSENPPENTKDEFAFPKITSTLQYRVEKLPSFGGEIGGGEIAGSNGGFDTGGGFPAAEPPPSGSSDFGGGSFDPGTTTGSTGTSGGFSAPAAAPAAPADTGVIAAPQQAPAPAVDSPVAAAESAPETAAQQPTAAAPAAAVNPPGFSPAVWVLPILAVALAGAMAWSLMSPAELAGGREGAVSKLMRARRLQAADASTPS